MWIVYLINTWWIEGVFLQIGLEINYFLYLLLKIVYLQPDLDESSSNPLRVK